MSCLNPRCRRCYPKNNFKKGSYMAIFCETTFNLVVKSKLSDMEKYKILKRCKEGIEEELGLLYNNIGYIMFDIDHSQETATKRVNDKLINIQKGKNALELIDKHIKKYTTEKSSD